MRMSTLITHLGRSGRRYIALVRCRLEAAGEFGLYYYTAKALTSITYICINLDAQIYVCKDPKFLEHLPAP